MSQVAAGFIATLRDDDRVLLVRLGDRLPEGYRVASIDTLGVVLEAGDATTRLSMRRSDQDDERSGRER